MRSLSTLKNVIMSLAYEVMLIVFGMIMPRLIISTYGSEVNGLTSTINQTLSILNLLQAGAVGASIFQMYKPVAEKDYYRVSLVLESSKGYFRKIGTIFLVLVVLVAPMMSALTQSGISFWEKMLAFVLLGVNGSFYFFFTSWFDILFSSHQKRFLLSVAGMVDKLLYYGLLFAVILLKLHFAWMYVAVLIGTCAKVAYLYFLYRREFKPKLVKVTPDASFKIENRGYLLCNQIATQGVDALPTVLITALQGLTAASVYAVYHLVQNMVKMVVRTVQMSVSEVFGNLVVSENTDRVRRVYNLLEFVFFLTAVVLCACAAFLFMPFIYLYTDGNTFDVNYLYPALAVSVVAYCLVYCLYMPCYTLTNVLGLFKQTYLQAVICAVIAVVLAVGLGMVYWPLILLGPVLYYISSLIYRLAVAKKYVSWLRLGSFLRRMAAAVCAVAASTAAGAWVYARGYPASWLGWLIHACVCGVSVVAVTGVYVALFERKAFRSLLTYGVNLLKKKRKG